MTKEILDKIINILKEKKLDIKFECMLFAGKANLRGIYVYNSKDKKMIKSLFNNEILKNFKFEKSLTWYLGDRKEIILLRFKKSIDIEISELENYRISNSE